MSDAETRALGRAAAILLVASVVRWGWDRMGAGAVPIQGPDESAHLLQKSRALAEDHAERARPLGPGQRIDPNRASARELDRLPGIGATTAQALVASRERDGPFRRPDDLTRVRGVGVATVARIRDRLDFEVPPPGPSPAPSAGKGAEARVDLNRARLEELQALPGIGPALARRIVQARTARPFTGPDDLLRVPGIGPATMERLRTRVTVRP